MLVSEPDGGEIFSWGSNKGNRLGHSDHTVNYLAEPKRIEALNNIVVYDICCGGGATIALCTEPIIEILYEHKITKIKIENNKITIGQIKEQLKRENTWKEIGDYEEYLFQDQYSGKFLHKSENMRELFLLGCRKLQFIEKLKVNQLIQFPMISGANQAQWMEIFDYSSLNYQFNQEDKIIIKAGKSTSIINWLINPLYQSNDYLISFLCNFRKFIQPAELLRILIDRFNLLNQIRSDGSVTVLNGHLYSNPNAILFLFIDNIQFRIIFILYSWIFYFSEDFFSYNESTNVILNDLHNFIEFISKSYPKYSFSLSKLYKRMVFIFFLFFFFSSPSLLFSPLLLSLQLSYIHLIA